MPIANQLLEDEDLQSVNCAYPYLPDYDLIVCRNLYDGKPCGYGVPLASLLAHCWGESFTRLTTCDRSPHHVPFCRRHPSSKGKSAYNSQQRGFIQKILAKFPNIVFSMGELRSLCMHTDQFGPIKHICAPTDGYACNSCYFVTYDIGKKQGEPLPMRDHWQKHCQEDASGQQ
ncbi:hypothetical protein JVT61DRAFT_10334 [Boletus reticuloceps]|uniref:Uncharacterized protein n=1 Tax=Boletus reticuloceps TaxID=495285 RepID=A0A8I2YUZ4_9AGAM|nr:hypothetical protein JVT61DRAFT_10334 [Boletus reticuloceps]